MFGAIIGDIVGSRFEFANTKRKDFELFNSRCRFTDDTVMTIAVADALIAIDEGSYERGEIAPALANKCVESMRKYGGKYPDCGYGGMFYDWLFTPDPQPYNSFGNGSAMRISPVGLFARSKEEVLSLAQTVAAVTHNHPEGIKGAQAIALSIYLAKWEKNKKLILDTISNEFYPQLKTDEFTYDFMHENYGWRYGLGSVTCQSSVPQAIACFLLSENFEDAIRLAVSIGGDSDTIAAMAGGIAEAYYGIPVQIVSKAVKFLPDDLSAVVGRFYKLLNGRSSKGDL